MDAHQQVADEEAGESDGHQPGVRFGHEADPHGGPGCPEGHAQEEAVDQQQVEHQAWPQRREEEPSHRAPGYRQYEQG